MVNIKNTDYIDTREIERIINDRWFHMDTTQDCGNDTGIFLDTTTERLEDLAVDLKYYELHEDKYAVYVRNEIKLIETLREAGYTDQILLLISY